MAKANLAVALAGAGDAPRARLAARQALAVAAAPEPVRAQAEAVLGGAPEYGDLARVLESEPRERWQAVVREEVVRWADDPDALAGEAAAWVEEQDDDRAEALLGGLLELPPEPFARVLGAVLAAGGASARVQLERAASVFHAPQELRVRETIDGLWSTETT